MNTISAEWTKVWSVRSTWWSLLAGVLLMAATAGQLAIYAANANTNDDPADDAGIVTVGSVVIGSVELTQYAVLALGLLVITSEFTSGTIRTTLQCTPSRGRVLLAKAVVTGAVTFALGLLLGAVGALVARPVLGRWGAAPAGGTVGDVLAVATYLALVGVLALGLGAALRSAVLTLTVLVATLMIVPLSLQGTSPCSTGSPMPFRGWPGRTSWPGTPTRTRRRSGCCCSPAGPARRCCWAAPRCAAATREPGERVRRRTA
jgi:ABC-type transport system involved in multi-copper enzyme maturation permease subunit